MLVEGPSEVDIEQLLVVDGQPHHPTGKPKVAQVIWVDIRQTVGLKCCTCDITCKTFINISHYTQDSFDTYTEPRLLITC